LRKKRTASSLAYQYFSLISILSLLSLSLYKKQIVNQIHYYMKKQRVDYSKEKAEKASQARADFYQPSVMN
jgi:hypothetical protein